jgi:hypothetical protein
VDIQINITGELQTKTCGPEIGREHSMCNNRTQKTSILLNKEEICTLKKLFVIALI